MTLVSSCLTISPLIISLSFVSSWPDCFSFLLPSFALHLHLNPTLICPHPRLNLSFSFSFILLFHSSTYSHFSLCLTHFYSLHSPSMSSVIGSRLHWLHLSWPWRAQCPLLSPNLGADTLATGLNTLAFVLFRRIAPHNCDTHTTHTARWWCHAYAYTRMCVHVLHIQEKQAYSALHTYTMNVTN